MQKVALEYRLINQICEESELINVALNTAKKLSAKPRELLIVTKALIERRIRNNKRQNRT